MVHWPGYLEQLQAVSLWLSRQPEREALMAEMKRSGASDRECAVLLRSFPTIIAWRWQSLYQVLKALVPLRSLLTTYVTSTEGGKGEWDEDTRLSALKSKMFWSYSSMLLSLQDCIEGLQSWSEACPCHGFPVGQSRFLRGKDFSKALGGKPCAFASCPMRGKRAPELACGALHALFKELAEETKKSWMTWRCDGLTAEETQLLLSDFSIGQERISTFLQLKLMFWRQLPWALAGILHHDSAIARDAAAQCLHQYDMNPESIGAKHRLSRLYCAALAQQPDSLRDQLQSFVEGCDLLTLQPLLKHLLPLKFIPCVERWVERQHSLVNTALAGKRRKHATVVSLANRLLEFEKRCEIHPHWLQEVAQQFVAVRQIRSLCLQFGFLADPILRHMHDNTKIHHTALFPKAIALFYHQDIQLQNRSLRPLERVHATQARKMAKAYAKGGTFRTKADNLHTFPALLAASLHAHLLSLCREDSSEVCLRTTSQSQRQKPHF